jgi:hypothetical protein
MVFDLFVTLYPVCTALTCPRPGLALPLGTMGIPCGILQSVWYDISTRTARSLLWIKGGSQAFSLSFPADRQIHSHSV